MKVYIASFYDTRKRLYPYRDALEAAGHSLTSRWLNQHAEEEAPQRTEQHRIARALQDLSDVRSSELLILDTFDITPRGGREFEMGIAIAYGIPVVLVGPMRNVFHRLAWRHFETWEETLDFLKDVKRT